MENNSNGLVVVLSRNYSTGLSVVRSLGSAGYKVDLVASAFRAGRSIIASSSKYVRNSVEVVSKKVKAIGKFRNTKYFYTVCFVLLLAVCGVFSVIGINIMYAAFIAGYLIKVFFGTDVRAEKAIGALKEIVFSFFVPVYFALVGIQLNVIHDFSFGRFCLFFVIAFGLEFAGTWRMLLFSDLPGDMRMNFAVTMNARGGPGIVLATVSYGANIISLEFFTVLILTTMLSSMIAGYYLRWQQRRDSKAFDEL